MDLELELKLSKRLKQLRKYIGISQEELSIATGVSLRTIEDYEQGKAKTPSAVTILLLASYFDVDPTTLLYGGDNTMNTIYKKAIIEELKQFSNFDEIKEIHDENLNGTVLSKLSFTEELITTVKSFWESKHLFDKIQTDGSFKRHKVYRSYVKDTIYKYCQNRMVYITKYNLRNGVDILNEINGIA